MNTLEKLQYISNALHRQDWKGWSGEVKISATQFKVLRYIATHPDCTLKASSTALCVSSATLSDSIGHLVNKGLIDRQRSELDSRKIKLRLTKAGKKLESSLENSVEVAVQMLPRRSLDTLEQILD